MGTVGAGRPSVQVHLVQHQKTHTEERPVCSGNVGNSLGTGSLKPDLTMKQFPVDHFNQIVRVMQMHILMQLISRTSLPCQSETIPIKNFKILLICRALSHDWPSLLQTAVQQLRNRRDTY